MSISGLHITLWAWLATAAVGRLWRWLPRLAPVWGVRVLLACPAPVAAAWGGGLLALAYALLAGWGVPAQRTVLMLAVVLGLRLLGRWWPWHAVAAVAAAVVLTWDPWAALQPGFWLSFVAVGVLLATGARPSRASTDEQPQGVWAQAWEAARQLGRTQWVVGLALAPLSLVWFGQVSLVGWGVNLLAIPWVTLVVTPLTLLAVVVPGLWDLAAAAVQVLVWALEGVGAWPAAVWAWAAPPLPLAGAALLGGLLAVARLPGAFRALGLALAVPAFLYVPPRPALGHFELVAADVGQGSAILVRTAHASVLIDAGPAWPGGGDAGQRVLLPWLQALADQPTDVVLTHSDTDHVGGALSVLAAHPQARVWASFQPPELAQVDTDPALLAQQMQAVSAGQRLWQRCQAGQRWERDGVWFEVLHPQPEAYAQRIRTNNLSCVVRVQGSHAAALVTGDLDAAHEARLVERYTGALAADVLVAPHHGSKHSSSTALLQAVNPDWVLVQAGYRNRYGHPAPEVLARYALHGVRWADTAHCGALRWHSAQPGAPHCQREEARRYWHWQGP